MDLSIQPCRDDEQLRAYINSDWREGHVLARDQRMFEFQYRTPWVDREVFPHGTSVMCAYRDDGGLAGFIGAIIAPYPRPISFWLALWHVLPETKGTGVGGRLLETMQEAALTRDGWVGTFGAGPQATPVYERRMYVLRGVRRWVFDGTQAAVPAKAQALHSAENRPDQQWENYRFSQHPVFDYERHGRTVSRTEQNDWGTVTHVVRRGPEWPEVLSEVFAREAGSGNYLMDCWSFEPPGEGWTLADNDLPSVFHPPEARGNLTFAVGRPFIPTSVEKGDCDQDRPN